MNQNRRRTLIVSAAVAVIVWQWGSYGPFYFDLSYAGDEELDDVLVTLWVPWSTSHRSGMTFKANVEGQTGQVVRVSRRFVCFCLSKPSIRYTISHPQTVTQMDGIDASAVGHFGEIRLDPFVLASMREFLLSPPAWATTDRGVSPESYRPKAFERHTHNLYTMYEPYVDVGDNGRAYIDALRDYMIIANVDEESAPRATEYFSLLEKKW